MPFLGWKKLEEVLTYEKLLKIRKYWFRCTCDTFRNLFHQEIQREDSFLGKKVIAQGKSWKILDNLDAEVFYVLFLGILGYKIHFDTNGDAEFNLTLLDMQTMRKLN